MARKKVFDRNILIIIAFVLLIALVVVIFKVVTGRKACPEVKFKASQEQTVVDEAIIFEDQTEGASQWDWDFGDSTSHDHTPNPTHRYKAAGDYTVMLTVNETCQESIHIVVKSLVVDIDTALPMGKINGPAAIEVGREATFSDASSEATSWEWSFAESGRVDATTQTAKYTFRSPGPHKVSLNINEGKCKTATMMVNVTAKVHPPDVKSNPNQIDEISFVKMLNDLHDPSRSYIAFDKYLDGNLNMQVTVNGKPKIFSSYCKILPLDTRHIVKRVSFIKDAKGYITGMDITEQIEQH